MKTIATAKIKIPNTKEITKTVSCYTKALQFCVNLAWNKKIKNNIKLHYLVYKDIRTKFKLPSQLAIACIKRACGIIKKAKSAPIIKNACVGYNFPRSARFKGDSLIFKTIKGRQIVKIKVPECYKEYFSWGKPAESLLRIDRKGKAYFLFTFSKEITPINTRFNSAIGVDLGINNLAVCSDNRFYNSFKIKQTKRKFRFLRGKLQTKGTSASRKLLRKISGKETRYMAWVNHNISKSIVSNISGNKIVMEDLKGIRKKHRGKTMNYWISNWSYFQLRNFIQYKAERIGIKFVRVKPYYTSQLCHRCGKLGIRDGGCFSCQCGLHDYNADLNASKNLAHPKLVERQAAVNQPYLTCDDAKASFDELRLNIVKSLAS
jgi:putative transposase